MLYVTVFAATVLPASAQSFSEVSLHSGTEVQNDPRWNMVSYSHTAESLGPNNPLPAGMHRLIGHEKVSASVGINLSRAHLKQFNHARYDIALIPTLRYTFNQRWYVSGGLGAAYNDLDEEDSENVRLKLGGRWFFAPEIKFGVVLTRQSHPWFLELIYGHRSNGALSEPNSGLDFFTLGLGARF